MSKIKITGGKTLSGSIRIGGAKNSVVALIPAALLADDIVKIANVPNISDVASLNEILEYLGAKVERRDDLMIINPSSIENKEIMENVSKKLRASYYFMGALLGKYKKVTMYFPGGCSIGARPINLHLKGFEALGAKVTEEGNKYIIEAEELIGNRIYLDIASVGATINLMLAAVLAKGTTTISNAAKEPQIVNIATFLNNMGAKITGAGTSDIKIVGVKRLKGCFHEVIPDPIEAGTYMIMGALLGENLKIENVIPEHVEPLLSKMKEIGVKMEIGSDYVLLNQNFPYRATNIKTLVHPGFPTDLQQPMTTLLTQCEKTSKVEETIWENRFMNVPYLNKMGANIEIKNNKILIHGRTLLHGEEVVATDLRAGACLIIAALIADGTTTILDVEHVLRGYENLIEKLKAVGAKIEFLPI